MEQQIRSILETSAHLGVPVQGLDANSDLFALGLSSLATVDVMLAIENAFDVEFSDEYLCRKTFRSIASLTSVVAQLKRQQAVP